MKRLWVYYMFRPDGQDLGYPMKTIGYGEDEKSAIKWVRQSLLKHPEYCSGFSAKPHRGKW